jgi:hypothetical protein
LQDGVGGAAGVAGDILLDVSTQHNFYLLLLETTLDDQLAVAVHRAACTQLSKQEVEQVLRLPMETENMVFMLMMHFVRL